MGDHPGLPGPGPRSRLTPTSPPGLTPTSPRPPPDPDLPRSIETSVPEALERFRLRCLARSPNDRYQEADSLAGDLRTFLAS